MSLSRHGHAVVSAGGLKRHEFKIMMRSKFFADGDEE